MTEPPIAAREVWWVHVEGIEKSVARKALVMRVEPDRVLAIYGQSKQGQRGSVMVRHGTVEGRCFDVSIDTYFRSENVHWFQRAAFKNKVGVCPGTKWIEFSRLVDDELRRRAGGSGR